MLLSYHLRSQWNKVEVLSQALELLDALRVRDALPNDEVSLLIWHNIQCPPLQCMWNCGY